MGYYGSNSRQNRKIKMKWLFLLIGVILLCFVSDVQEFAHEEARDTIKIGLDSSATDNSFAISEVLGLLDRAANRGNGQHLFQRLFPVAHKFYFGGFLLSKNAELIRKGKIVNYIQSTESNIVRFCGPSIIYPFNYFW